MPFTPTKHLGYSLIMLSLLLFSCKEYRIQDNPKSAEYIIKDSTMLKAHLAKPAFDTLDLSFHRPVWNFFLNSGRINQIVKDIESYHVACDKAGYINESNWSAVYLSQAYNLLNKDSLFSIYRDKLIGIQTDDKEILDAISYILASDALKNELNYGKAINYFLQSYENNKESENVRGMLSSICNIMRILFLRSDSTGLEYTLIAQDLINTHTVEDAVIIVVQLEIAKTQYLNSDYESALLNINRCHTLSQDNKIYHTLAEILYIQAMIYHKQDKIDLASEYFRKSAIYLENSHFSIKVDYYYYYGLFLASIGEYERAINSFFTAKNIAKENNSLIHLASIFSNLSKIYSTLGRPVERTKYNNAFHHLTDSILLHQREREFNTYRILYQQAKHQEDIQKNEISLLKARKQTTLIATIFGGSSILIIFLWILHFNRSRANKTLVSQHLKHLKKQDLLRPQNSQSPSSKNQSYSLFLQIEHIMKSEKLYRETSLNIDVIAEKLNTNRKYISKAINENYGQSFFNYINSLRIEEATVLLSNKNTPLKQIIIDVGYTSSATFYRAFKKEVGCSPSEYCSSLNKIKNILT